MNDQGFAVSSRDSSLHISLQTSCLPKSQHSSTAWKARRGQWVRRRKKIQKTFCGPLWPTSLSSMGAEWKIPSHSVERGLGKTHIHQLRPLSCSWGKERTGLWPGIQTLRFSKAGEKNALQLMWGGWQRDKCQWRWFMSGIVGMEDQAEV